MQDISGGRMGKLNEGHSFRGVNMRAIFSLLVVALMLLPGCASQEAYQNYLAAFEKASEANKVEAAKPLVDITLPAPLATNGQPQAPYRVVVNKDYKPMVPQQIKDSEWTGTVMAAIGITGLVGNHYVDYKIKQSDNAAAVDIAESRDASTTAQVQAYTDKFNKETTTTVEKIESTYIGEMAGEAVK